MSDDIDFRYKTAVEHFQEAKRPAAYLEVINEFTSLLSDPKNLSLNTQFTCRFFIAMCEKNLNMLDGAKSRLQDLLKDISNDLGENNVLICSIKLELAEILRNTGDWEEAIRMFKNSSEHFRENGDRFSEVSVYLEIANIWGNQNNLEEADASLNEAWSVLQFIPESPLHVKVLFTRGHYCYLKGDLKSAIEMEERALEIAIHLGNRESEKSLIHNLAKFTFDIKDYPRSVQYHQRLLDIARADNKTEEIINLLAHLGMCYTETGQSKKAIESLNEILSLNTNSSSVKSDILILVLVIKATALVDMKKHVEASELLIQARKIVDNSEANIIDDLEKRIKNETRGPMAIDCAHRIIHMAFADISGSSSHSNPSPGSKFLQADNLSHKLTNDEREEFKKIYLELKEFAQTLTLRQPSGNKNVPDQLMIPIKCLNAEEPQEFGKKWQAFIDEKHNEKIRKEIKVKWDSIENRMIFSKESPPEDTFGHLTFINELADIAHLCAISKNRKALCEVALYTADFLEVSANDMLAALIIWCTRARLLASVFISARPECKELLESEISYSYQKAQEVFWQMNQERRIVSLNFIYNSWFIGAKITRNKNIYRRLAEITGEISGSLDTTQKILYGIALCESGDSIEGEKIINSSTNIGHVGSNAEQKLSPQIRKFVAINRFKILHPDIESCKSTYGPFSPWIYGNVSEQEIEVDVPFEDEIFLPTQFPALVFTSNNLAVFKKDQQAPLLEAAWAFVLHNQAYLSKQMFRTEEGTWFPTLRGAPCTQALMFSELYNPTNKDEPTNLNPEIRNLISIGNDCVERDPKNAGLYIMNTCDYFEHCMTNTADASYACGAILSGMAYGFLHDMIAVKSYLTHLQIMDHENALIYGKNKSVLLL
jgi:tetratricopeptide (TPR) repeat protein